MQKKKNYTPLVLFFVLIAASAFANALSDSIYSNYFKEAYQVTALQRGQIEFPRELPGLLCAFVIAALSALGDLRIALIAQVLAFCGLTALGLLTPPFGVMLIFLFINSLGMHLFMPLQDAIGMSLAEPDKVGKRMGQYASTKAGVVVVAGLLTFFGFRLGWFSFTTPVKWVFIIGAAFFFVAIVVNALLVKTVQPPRAERKKIKLVFRKEYKYYYLLTILNGVQKQIAFVYGTWVIVDLLHKRADTVSLLLIAVNFIGVFFLRVIGKWMDRFGIKKMMYVDALTFIGVYVLYGIAVWLISDNILQNGSFWVGSMIFVLYIMDRISMQFGMVKSIYMRSIALCESDVTATLTMGTTLDHCVSIVAASLSGLVWTAFGPQWVFFIAAFFSLGNLFVAWRVDPEKEHARALAHRAQAKQESVTVPER